MKLLRIFVSVLAIPALFVMQLACSDDDNPIKSNPPVETYMWVHLDADSTRVDFAALPKIDAGGEEAIQLSEFIDTVLIAPFRDKDGNPYEARRLYSYQIVADDGFSASENKGYPNNIWSQLELGHILTASRQVVFPDDQIDIAGAYNVKGARHIFVWRKLDVEMADTTFIFELKACTPTPVLNFDDELEDAVCLSNGVNGLVSNPQDFQYNIRSLDGFGPSSNMSWDQFQTGFWLLNSERTKFNDEQLVGGVYKLKALEKIILEP